VKERSRTAAAALAAALAAAVGSGHRTAAADPGDQNRPLPCSPSARVAGPDELARRIRLELAVLGVRTEAIPASCPAVDVAVSAAGEQVSVSLRDASGRQAAQVVTDAHVAATWIESWVHPEIGAPLLAARIAVPVTEVEGPPEAPAAGRRDLLEFRGFVIGAEAEKLYGSDDSDWRGVGLSACARWGLVCPGLSARLYDNRGHQVEHANGPAVLDRLGGEVMAGVSAPFEIGRMRLAPGVAVGVGLLRSLDVTCGLYGQDEGCPKYYGSSYSIGPRAEMGVSGAFPIASRVSLVLSGSLSFAPMARREPSPLFGMLPGDTNPDGSQDENVDPSDDGQVGPNGEELSLPAEPSRFTCIGLGLAVDL
jgi:hypothetical protein